MAPGPPTNAITGAIACATGGLGITSAPLRGCQDELNRGLLVRVLADWQTNDLSVHAYFPLGRSARKVARAFVDFVTEEFRKL